MKKQFVILFSESFHHARGNQAGFFVGKRDDSVFRMENDFMDIAGGFKK